MKPIKKFVSGALVANIWNNEKDGKNYNTISFERRYKDKEGNWKSTNSLRINDLPKASLVLSKTFEYLVIRETDELVA